jgi:hypothetical protein
MAEETQESNRTDQAALFGAALTAILSIVVAPGAWAPFNVIIGMIITGILAAYYRPITRTGSGFFDLASKAFAFAAVAALCGSILVAYPYQEIIIKHMQDTRDYCSRSFFTSQGATERTVDDLQSDCIGGMATDKLWLPYVILFALAVWIRWVAPRPLPRPPGRKNTNQ